MYRMKANCSSRSLTPTSSLYRWLAITGQHSTVFNSYNRKKKSKIYSPKVVNCSIDKQDCW